MSTVCFYFEVHQPYRLRPYDAFRVGWDHEYFDERLNREVMQKVARKCYLPANEAILRLIERHQGRFRVAYSLTGVVLEQMQLYAPEVIESFQALVRTGAVELLAETYYHSLAAIDDPHEFEQQVALHGRTVRRLFGVTPRVLRNTELIYDDALGQAAERMGFEGVLAEGADDILDWRSPNFVYRAAGSQLPILLRNYRLSDDIAFRFSNHGWADFPLTAEKFARWVHALSGDGDVVGLFMDYETFGEHQWSETGIFDFLDQLPRAVLAHEAWEFGTPSDVIARHAPVGPLSFPRTTSWADLARDLTAWSGNDMQRRALSLVRSLGDEIKRRNNPALLALWRKLTSSDHFYYMSTKWFGDGDVHAYFSPYESPYEAFINYMNVLTDLDEAILARAPADAQPSPALAAAP